MNEWSDEIQNLLDASVVFHGHLCGGQVIGVRMAVAGLNALGILNPKSKEGRNLIIFAECDRCPIDAIISVTGRTPGKRSVRLMDYGKTAATFCDVSTGKAVRVAVKSDIFEKAKRTAQENQMKTDKNDGDIYGLKYMAEDELLTVQNVRVEIAPQDLPGLPLETVTCCRCGETVKDRRHIVDDGKTLCRPCAYGVNYYGACSSDSGETGCGTVIIKKNGVTRERN